MPFDPKYVGSFSLSFSSPLAQYSHHKLWDKFYRGSVGPVMVSLHDYWNTNKSELCCSALSCETKQMGSCPGLSCAVGDACEEQRYPELWSWQAIMEEFRVVLRCWGDLQSLLLSLQSPLSIVVVYRSF